jgi:hypothetical protein
MVDLRESAGLQQIELVGFFPVDGLLAPQQPQISDFPRSSFCVAQASTGRRLSAA